MCFEGLHWPEQHQTNHCKGNHKAVAYGVGRINLAVQALRCGAAHINVTLQNAE